MVWKCLGRVKVKLAETLVKWAEMLIILAAEMKKMGRSKGSKQN